MDHSFDDSLLVLTKGVEVGHYSFQGPAKGVGRLSSGVEEEAGLAAVTVVPRLS